MILPQLPPICLGEQYAFIDLESIKFASDCYLSSDELIEASLRNQQEPPNQNLEE